MSCEKYSGWLTGAALGALGDAEEAELRAHAAGCSHCRSEWEMIRALAAAVDRGVEAMVAGGPSPQFVARLRARIAEEPARSARPLVAFRRVGLATLAAAAVVVAILFVRTAGRERGPAEVAVVTLTNTGQQSAVSRTSSLEHPSVDGTALRGHRAAGARGRPDFFPAEVLVPKGQMAAALLLSEGVSTGRIDGGQLARLAERSAEPLDWRALDIQPLAAPSAGEEAVKAANADEGDRN